jgi:hypothetical protein
MWPGAEADFPCTVALVTVVAETGAGKAGVRSAGGGCWTCTCLGSGGGPGEARKICPNGK